MKDKKIREFFDRETLKSTPPQLDGEMIEREMITAAQLRTENKSAQKRTEKSARFNRPLFMRVAAAACVMLVALAALTLFPRQKAGGVAVQKASAAVLERCAAEIFNDRMIINKSYSVYAENKKLGEILDFDIMGDGRDNIRLYLEQKGKFAGKRFDALAYYADIKASGKTYAVYAAEIYLNGEFVTYAKADMDGYRVCIEITSASPSGIDNYGKAVVGWLNENVSAVETNPLA